VTVALLAVHPEDVPNSLAPVSDAELERYYGAHQVAFKRPAAAWVSYVELPRIPNAADSAAALAHARRLRAEIAEARPSSRTSRKRESPTPAPARGAVISVGQRTGPVSSPPSPRRCAASPRGC